MLGMQLYESFTELLLNNLLRGDPGGKGLLMMARNYLPRSVARMEL